MIIAAFRGALLSLSFRIHARLEERGVRSGSLQARELRYWLRWHRHAEAQPDPLGDLRRAEASRWSQHGEDGLLAALTERLDLPARSFVEIGAADGVENCTRALAESGWQGVWFEGDEQRAEHARNVASHLDVQVRHAMVTSRNVLQLLEDAGVAREPGVLVVDIDGNDFWVLRSVLRRHRPGVLVLEYNAAFPPGRWWTRRNRPTAVWDSTFREGASLDALTWLCRRAGYSLVACESAGVNSFFVRDDLLTGTPLAALAGDVAQHYRPMRLVPPSWGHPKLPTPGCKVLTEQERSEISISGGSRPPTVSQSGEVEVSAVIDNGSSTWLRSTGDHPIHFSGRWLDSNGVVLEGDAERNALVGGIPPGKRREVVGIFRAVPGATAVRLTLVQEHIAWFDEQAVAAEVRLP